MIRTASYSAILICIFTPIASGGPVADYGDAPDNIAGGFYPSKFGSTNATPGMNSPFHFDTSREWLGTAGPPSNTSQEADSLQVNADNDDSGSSIFMLNAAGIGQRGYLYTTASYDPNLTTANQTRYLNAAVDFNNNGQWGDVSATQREWVVRNVPFNFNGLPAGVTSANIFVGFHLDPTLVGATNRWTRVTLTTAPINPPGEWNGSGPAIGFARGETEDFINQTILTSTLDGAGVVGGNAGGPWGGGGGGGFGGKTIGPVGVKVVADITPDGFHALTPAGPGPLVHVADVKFNVPQAAVNPGNAFGGKGNLDWIRTCDIGGGDCNHLPFLGPNPVAAIMDTTINGAAQPLSLSTVNAFIDIAAGQANTLPIRARFPNQFVNGDTHSFVDIWVDPAGTFYLNLQNDDSDLYAANDMYDTDIGHPYFIYPVGTPEPSSVMLVLGAMFVAAPARLLRRGRQA
jgi:hypothetical protein